MVSSAVYLYGGAKCGGMLSSVYLYEGAKCGGVLIQCTFMGVLSSVYLYGVARCRGVLSAVYLYGAEVKLLGNIHHQRRHHRPHARVVEEGDLRRRLEQRVSRERSQGGQGIPLWSPSTKHVNGGSGEVVFRSFDRLLDVRVRGRKNTHAYSYVTPTSERCRRHTTLNFLRLNYSRGTTSAEHMPRRSGKSLLILLIVYNSV